MLKRDSQQHMESKAPGFKRSRQIHSSAKATGDAPQFSCRSSEPISEIQDLLYLVRGRTGISVVLHRLTRCAAGAAGEMLPRPWARRLLRKPEGERIDER